MAYNNGYPVNYPQMGYPQMAYQQPQVQNQMYPQNQQSYQQPQQIPQQPQQTPQIQNGGFMLIPNEDMARTYPVAPGNCVTFKIEGKPIVMEKSMGFSQLEAPRIDKYRLVREEEIQEQPEPEPKPEKEPKPECHCNQYIDELKEQFNHDLDKIWSEIDVLKEQISKPSTSKKKDAGGN